jgi:hypothetical protein
MRTPVSIIVGSALIAAAILVTNRWAITGSPMNLAAVVRLDRWTGAAELCAIDVRAMKGTSVAGLPFECRPQ